MKLCNTCICFMAAFLATICVNGLHAADVTIGTMDPGVTLTVNGTNANPSDVFSFADSNTVTFVTAFGGQQYTDVIESHYNIDVSVHATNYDGNSGSIYLDTDMGYTPYDIFVITSTNSDDFYIYFDSPPADDAVKILGLHLMMPNADTYLYALGSSSHSGTPSYLAEVFYGTVENNGTLYIEPTTDSDMGSSFNKIVGKRVIFNTSSSDAHDIMIQELYSDDAETDDTEISWWRMELTGAFYCDDYDGYSLNDELPELATLTDDGMVWFKARNPAKWQMWPLIKADEWIFDNYDYEDYNFWEMQLQGDFRWYNDDDYYEYAHFIGPVLDCESWTWTPYDCLYVNFFGDDDSNYYDSDRFDGDYGSAGADFWNQLLTAAVPDGYGYTEGSIIAPIFLFKVDTGQIGDAYYDTYCALADNQDILILSGVDELNFYESSDYFYFDQGTNSHWCVENGLTYNGEVPTDDAFDITIVDFDISLHGDIITCVASNNYNSGDDTDSTMYMAYRYKNAYGRQFTRVPMIYDAGSGLWSNSVALPIAVLGEYYFCTVAVENDDVYGKVVEHDVEVRSGADLSVWKTANTNVAPGAALSFTVTVSNAGPDMATNVIVTDVLPAGLIPSGAIVNNLGNMANGSVQSFVLNATVGASTRGWITNVVSVISSTQDNNFDNNTNELAIWVKAYASLTVGADPALGFEQSVLPALPSSNYPIGQFSFAADGTGIKLDEVAVDLTGTYSGLLGSDPYNLFAANTNDFASAFQIIGNTFYLTDLTSDNSDIIGHDAFSGDDRGGIAVTPSYVYYVGDNNTVRMNADDLSGMTSLPQRDGIFSDLKTGNLYTLWDTTTTNDPEETWITDPGFNVTSLRSLDADLNLGGTIITLSTPVMMDQDSGIFAGYGFVILWQDASDTFNLVEIPSGQVTVLGTGSISKYSTENWVEWGVAEKHLDGRYSVVYRASAADRFDRMYCDDASTETVATFSDISDLACFTYSPWNNRWYFHHEYGSGTFGGSDETLGYGDADARITEGIATLVGNTVTFAGLNDSIPAGTRYYWVTVDLGPAYSGTIMGNINAVGDITLNDGLFAVASSSFGDLDVSGDYSSAGLTPNDFDGDGVSDLCVYDIDGPAPGTWYFMQTTDGYQPQPFGYAGTVPVSGDFDGDGKTDYGVYDAAGGYGAEEGSWYLTLSTAGFTSMRFGYPGTTPLIGDFDGDGISDYGVYDAAGIPGLALPGSWYVMQSSAGFATYQFGYDGVVPVVGDFDGDGTDDLALYDAEGHAGQPAGSWYFMRSTAGYGTALFGYAGTAPIVGDFDGDGMSDYGVYDAAGIPGLALPGSWYFMRSTAGFATSEFGYAGALPVVGDFDGDGISDYGIYDELGSYGQPEGSWYFMRSTAGYSDTVFGYSGAVPVSGREFQSY